MSGKITKYLSNIGKYNLHILSNMTESSQKIMNFLSQVHQCSNFCLVLLDCVLVHNPAKVTKK